MSVIVETPEGQIMLLTKGADGAMFNLEGRDNEITGLNMTISSSTKSEEIKNHINKFSCQGYRTLVYGYRFVSR